MKVSIKSGDIDIRKARLEDLEGIAEFYDLMIDDLTAHENYPRWKKNEHPTVEEAAEEIAEQSFYLAERNGQMVGNMILNHKAEDGFNDGDWQIKATPEEVYIIHSLAVHPDFQGQGLAKAFVAFAEDLARKEHCKAIRLSSVEGNFPASNLYETCGYVYRGTVSLGYEDRGLPRFDLYEKVL